MLRFIDSFDHYVDANTYKKWTNKGAGISNVITTGRHGNGMLVGSGGVINKTLTHQSGWTVGWAYQLANAQSGVALICSFLHVGTEIATVRLNEDSTLGMYAGNNINNTHLIGITSGPSGTLQPGVWYYIEVQISLSGSSNISVTGTLRINGTTQFTGSKNSDIDSSLLIVASATTNVVQFGGGLIDDVYMLDNVATDPLNNPALITFLGDVKIGVILPNRDITTGFTAVGGPFANHYQYVNEIPPDDDTTYLSSSVIGTTEAFGWQPIPGFSGTVKGVQYLIYARKDDEGSRTLKQIIGVNEELSVPILLSDQYSYYIMTRENDPATGSPWTQSGFNAKQFGVQVVVNP